MPKGRSGRRHTLKTSRGTTYLGGGRRTYTRKAGGKVSKRGAYRPAQKKNFMRKRAAVVETKRKTREDLRDNSFWVGSDVNAPALFADRMAFTATNDEVVHINPHTYYWWSQGLSQPQHIGQNVTVKHLNQKIQVRFPQHSMAGVGAGSHLIVPNIPQKYTLYWGWIPAPRNLTGLSTPPVNSETVAALDSYVNNRIKDYFNDRKDRLRFIPKKDSTLRISGSKQVRPDLRYSSTAPLTSQESSPGVKYTAGSIPDWYGEISWKMPNGGKKLWFEQTGNMNGSPGEMIGMFPNFSWLPFACLVNWNHSELVDAHGAAALNYMPAISSNDIVYFTDS